MGIRVFALIIIVFPSVALAVPEIKYVSPNNDISAKLIFYIQPQYQFLTIDDQGKTNSFQIRRGRIGLQGHAFVPELTYKLLFEMIGGRVSNASPGVAYTGPNLKDAYLNYAVKKAFQMRIGQFKAYYDREELTPDTDIQFVDHSLINEVFSFNRDLGAALHGELWESKLVWAAYAVNDAANLNAANRDKFFVLGTRLVWNILGNPGYTMSDYENTDAPEWSVAVASAINKVGPPTTASQFISTTTLDTLFKHRGFSFTGEGHYYWNKATQAKVMGVLAQTGYFIVPKRFEIASRFSGVVVKGGGTNGYEIGGCLNYYFFGHNLKIQADYNYLINGALTLGTGGAAGVNGPTNIVRNPGLPGFNQGQNDNRVRIQFQLLI